MALQNFNNYSGLLIVPAQGNPGNIVTSNSASSFTLNAAGESVAGIGKMRLSTGPGTSKTISSAGGKIFIATNAVTWANAATNLRVGIQDVVNTTGIEDTTYDVQADLVPGTETITASSVNTVTMESGTKTISDGDIVAIVVEMTARGGADSVVIRGGTSSSETSFPYSTSDTGAGPALSGIMSTFTVQFDDGTYGWIDTTFTAVSGSGSAFSSSTTPDEYALIFRLPVKANLIGMYANLVSVAGTDDFEAILYSDPLGTPVPERTIVVDANIMATGSQHFRSYFSTPYTANANTDYAIAIRPTTTNTLFLSQWAFGSGNGALRTPTLLGTNWSLGTRTDQTGAFSSNTEILPVIGVAASFDDGAGGSGGVSGPISWW